MWQLNKTGVFYNELQWFENITGLLCSSWSSRFEDITAPVAVLCNWPQEGRLQKSVAGVCSSDFTKTAGLKIIQNTVHVPARWSSSPLIVVNRYSLLCIIDYFSQCCLLLLIAWCHGDAILRHCKYFNHSPPSHWSCRNLNHKETRHHPHEFWFCDQPVAQSSLVPACATCSSLPSCIGTVHNAHWNRRQIRQ